MSIFIAMQMLYSIGNKVYYYLFELPIRLFGTNSFPKPMLNNSCLDP